MVDEQGLCERTCGDDRHEHRPQVRRRCPGVEPSPESPDTTHFSVIDDEGNIIANTYTLNFSFGSAIAVAGGGFLLNNEMDDFVPNRACRTRSALLGGDANAIAAGKRPLSSMTPTIVLADGEPWFATGSPGGSRIITTVLQLVVNVIDHGMNLAAGGARPAHPSPVVSGRLATRARLQPGYDSAP